ncbi:hypothetical protein EBB07_01335 [Paenibacillaceae bacterium]|nr:hypothetical protein EBB07_01335 [Paenibacillaceae bacterium]
MITNLLLRLLFIFEGGNFKMAIVTVYVTLILVGRRTFEQVPASLQSAVETELNTLGLDTDGKTA